jgi:hypothetical protein
MSRNELASAIFRLESGAEPGDPPGGLTWRGVSVDRSFPEPALRRWGRKLRFPLVGTAAIFAVVLLIGSGLALAPPPGHFYPQATSPSGVVRVVAKGTLNTFWVNFTGGAVSTSNVAYYYHLFWFFGQSNATGNISVVDQAISPPTACTLTTNCTSGTTDTINRQWNATGSYDVSVTIYDGQLDYTIYTFVVTVVDPTIKLILPCFGAPGGPKNNAQEGQPEEYWALGEYTSNSSPVGGLTYLYNWGDGQTTYGVPSLACALTNSFYAQHRWNDSGSYIVTVSAYDRANGLSARAFWEVNVTNPPPQLGLNGVTFTPIVGATAATTVSDPILAWACATDVPADLSNLSVLWNFGDGPDSATTAGNSPPCWYESGGSVFTISNTVNITTTHAYTRAGTYHYTIRLEDEEGAMLNATPTPNTIVVTLGAYANATKAIPRTVGSALILDAANLTSLSTPAPGFNYTWVGGGAKGYGPQYPATSFVAGAQTPHLYINNTTTGAAIISNTQTITWATPSPNAGVTFAGFELSSPPSFQILSNPSEYATITFSVYCDGVPCGQTQLNSPNSQINLPVPLQLPLDHSYSVSVQFSPNPSFPNAIVTAQLIEVFSSNTTHAVGTPFTFNAANPATWGRSVDLMATARGQPVYLTTQLFSPAADSLTTTWAWGDATTSGSYTSTAGSATAPTLYTYQEVHPWAAGHAYTLLVTVQDGALSQARKYGISEVADPTINDTAPTASLSAKTVFEDAPTGFSLSLQWQNPHERAGPATWNFGDGGVGQGLSPTYRYHFGGKFVAAADVYSPNGTSSVEWAWITVKEPMPVAGFLTSPSTLSVDLPVHANASLSASDSYGAYGLTYYWNWGDGATSGGGSWAGMGTSHAYGTAGTYRITLTVIDNEGQVASTSAGVTVNALTLAATLPVAFYVTAGMEAILAPTFTSLPPAGQPFLNGTWTWNDGSANPIGTAWDTYHWGVVGHHTFAEPGKYPVNLVLSDTHGGTPARLSTYVNVIDPVPMVLASYADAVVYGENHTATFTQGVLGSWADRNAGTTTWTVTWQWGDGSNPTVSSVSSFPASAGHVYATSVPATLVVSVQTPWAAAYSSTGVSVDPLFLVPDWDGDGLPNEYETTITHTNPGFAETFGSPPRQGSTGNGFTDFLSQQLGVGNPSTDIDGDGLTTLQEMLGSVTGYVSNPLDPNTAGDGISDGSHFFTDIFPATQVVSLPAPGNSVWLRFPNVSYGGFGPAFNSSKLSLEFDTPTPGTLATSVTLSLVAGDGNAFVTVPAQNANVNTFYLLNRTPYGSPQTSFGVSLGDFGNPSTWSLEVTVSSGIVGSIASADISVSYYTNPSLADPTFQGMLEGPGLTTAVYNCSGPTTESYPVYNPATLSFSAVHYWPYTETYYKLSVIQGVPYVTGHDPIVGNKNIQSGACPSSLLQAGLADHTASYLGDEDFGISPWNAHAAGDSALTNGMKGLGATNYTLTAGLYESYTQGGVLVQAPTWSSYPTDPLQGKSGNPDYLLPLNPTAFSTAGTGIADSAAPDPLHALGLEITLSSANDPTCFPTVFTPQYIASVTLTSSSVSPQPIIYTPAVSGSGGSSCGFLGLGSTGFTATFNDYYFLPVDNTQSSWSVQFDLWQNQTMTAEGSHVSVDLSGSMTSLAPVSTPSGSGFTATAQLVPMQRTPVILENTTGELQIVPGYGYRFSGSSSQFEAFYINMGSQYAPPSPYAPGVNLVLESQSAYAMSAFNQSLVTNPSNSQVPAALSCLSSALVTTRGSGATPAGINQSWSVNLTTQSQQSCGSTLLTELQAENTTGVVVGQYQALGTDQVERLGLAPGTIYADPYQAPSGFGSPMGTPATNWVQEFTTAVLSALQALAGAIVAFANFMAQLVTLLAKALAQALVGAFNAAVAGVTALAKDVANLWNWILTAVAAIFNAVAAAIEGAILSEMKSLAAGEANDELSWLYDTGLITMTEYTTEIADFSGGTILSPHGSVKPATSGPLPMAQVTTDWNAWGETLLAVAAGVIVGAIAAYAAATLLSAGSIPATVTLLKMVAQKQATQFMENKIQATLTIIAGALTNEFLNAFTSGSASNVKAAAKVIGLGAAAAGLLGSFLTVFSDFGPWKMVKGTNVGTALAFSMVLDMVSLTLGAIAFTMQFTSGPSYGVVIVASLALLMGVASLSYQSSLTAQGFGAALFPVGLLNSVGSYVGVGAGLYTALAADATIN